MEMAMANLKELFPEFYQTDLNAFDLSSQSDNLIVIDTNFLLDIIQLPTTVSKKYIEALEKTKTNIYIPYLVALEFNFRKSSIKKNKLMNVRNYKSNIEKSLLAIEKNIKTTDLVDENEKNDFVKSMLTLTKNFSNELVRLIDKNIESIITKEESELYDKLIKVIENNIGDKYEQEWINEVEKDGSKRYEEKIPPGYNDLAKDGEEEPKRRYCCIEYHRKYGDLLIWKDIIEYSRDCDKVGKKVIFITNDGKSTQKNDLLYKVNNLIVGPNIHMMNELRMIANKEFYILNNLRFVQLVNDLSDSEMNELETSSEQLYKLKIPNGKIEEGLKAIREMNSEDSEFEYGIDDNGYLFRREKINIDKNLDSDKRTREIILRTIQKQIRQNQNKEDYINSIIKKNFKKLNDYEDIEKNLNFFEEKNYIQKYLNNKDYKKLYLDSDIFDGKNEDFDGGLDQIVSTSN